VDSERGQAELDTARAGEIAALNAYYAVSVRLARLLNLDPAVMLVPAAGSLREEHWLPSDVPLPSLLERAALQRPDLAAVRKRLGVASAAQASTIFAVAGPQLQASATLANTPKTQAVTDTMFRQQIHGASASLNVRAA
jgi:hypothetical protein